MHMSQAIVIMLCPSSICRGYFFHIFDFYSETAERNSMKLTYRKQNLNVLYKVCVFSGRWEKQDGLHGLAETFSTYLLKPLNGIQQNLTGSKILMSSTKFCVFRVHLKDKMAVTVCPGLWLAETFLTSPLKPLKLKGIQGNLTGSKISTSMFSSTFVFLCPRIEWSGAYCFCPVCLSVCLSVCLFVCLLSTLTFAIIFEP